MDRRQFGALVSCFVMSLRARAQDVDESMPDDALSVFAAVLRPSGPASYKGTPVLIADKPFQTAAMTVSLKTYTAMDRATHQSPDLPYLHPPANQASEAGELADAYNIQRQRPRIRLRDAAVFDFPHKFLNDEEVVQFLRLHPGGNVSSPQIEAARRNVPRHYRALFAGASALLSVSQVAFNTSRSRAVVGVRWSQNGCDSESWYALERGADDRWHDLGWSAGIALCA